MFNSIYNDYANKRINIYDAINKALFLNITPLFDEYNSLVNTVSSESLLEGIFTQLYKYINSQVGADDIIIQETRKSLNDKNNKGLQSILINTSKVLSSIETSGIKSVIKNNEGNSLPLNQMICLAYLHKDIVNRIE